VTAPLSGNVSGDLSVSGTLAKPEMSLSVAARSVKSPKAGSVAPADADVKMSISNSRLTLDAVAKQRDIQPVTVKASLPFDVGKLRAKPALLRDLPLMVAVKLPKSPLAFRISSRLSQGWTVPWSRMSKCMALSRSRS
jgi:hypothetical protein